MRATSPGIIRSSRHPLKEVLGDVEGKVKKAGNYAQDPHELGQSHYWSSYLVVDHGVGGHVVVGGPIRNRTWQDIASIDAVSYPAR